MNYFDEIDFVEDRQGIVYDYFEGLVSSGKLQNIPDGFDAQLLKLDYHSDDAQKVHEELKAETGVGFIPSDIHICDSFGEPVFLKAFKCSEGSAILNALKEDFDDAFITVSDLLTPYGSRDIRGIDIILNNFIARGDGTPDKHYERMGVISPNGRRVRACEVLSGALKPEEVEALVYEVELRQRECIEAYNQSTSDYDSLKETFNKEFLTQTESKLFELGKKDILGQLAIKDARVQVLDRVLEMIHRNNVIRVPALGMT